jgi:exopolysaccharide biosynthesis WecB/TagA/CpsF family protein
MNVVAPETELLPVRWFLGVPFTPLTLADAAARIAGRRADAPFVFVTTPNAQHVVSVSRGNDLFARAHDAAWMSLNDSKIMHMLSRRLFGEELPLAPGSDLTAWLFHHHIRPEDPITVIGGSEEVERLLRAQFGLRTLARYNPPMGFYNSPAEIDRCADFILAHPARYVFLAVGVPQSETVARRLIERGGATGVGLCVGSSLHFVTGVVQRAPAIFRRLGMEWAYRLLQNPRRHARRVFVDSLPVLWIALRTWLTPPSRRPHIRPDRR